MPAQVSLQVLAAGERPLTELACWRCAATYFAFFLRLPLRFWFRSLLHEGKWILEVTVGRLADGGTCGGQLLATQIKMTPNQGIGGGI
jgi:hypothetical protein